MNKWRNSKVKKDKANEIQLTVAIDNYIKDEKQVSAFLTQGDIFDCGDKLQYILANLEFSMKEPSMKTQIKNYLKTRQF